MPSNILQLNIKGFITSSKQSFFFIQLSFACKSALQPIINNSQNEEVSLKDFDMRVDDILKLTDKP